MVTAILSSLDWVSLLTHPLAIIIAIAAMAAFAATVVIRPSGTATSEAAVRRLGGSPPERSSAGTLPLQQPPASVTAPLDTDPGRGEKRRSLRRKGVPVPVLVHDSKKPGELGVAWVMDRSAGGLRLIFSRALARGEEFSVRAENAPDDSPWIAVRAAHGRAIGKRWIVGCQFIDRLPWNVLLLFG